MPLRSSHSRSALMQGWRSIMQGSPQQSVGKSLSGFAAQKNGLDLAWRLNGTHTPLSWLSGSRADGPATETQALQPKARSD